VRKQIIESLEAPKPIGPYSHAVRLGDLVFSSGMIGLDPKNGELVRGGVRAETRQVMENLAAVLRAGGASFAEVLRVTIYLTNLGDYPEVNEVYGSYFISEPPARSTVQVAALPRGAAVEIDAIASVGA
jgi:2-iminobutanoate/2-iminopropanoate deaminase